MIAGSGTLVQIHGELIKKFLGSDLKFHLYEVETYREILKSRDDLVLKYDIPRQEKSLTDRKEKLFKSKKFAKWGYQGENGVIDIVKVHE
jgi:hypothetical protein